MNRFPMDEHPGSMDLPLESFHRVQETIEAITTGRKCTRCLRRPATGPGLCDACRLFPRQRRDGIAMAEIVRVTLPEANIFGITGTRNGMTDGQKAWLDAFLESVQMYAQDPTIRHGDCVGVDDEADQMAARYNFRICIHPPKDSKLRAYCVNRIANRIQYQPLPYLSRDRVIVHRSQVTIGFPKSMTNRNGGTWYTIDYSRSNRKPTIVVNPEGLAQIKTHIPQE